MSLWLTRLTPDLRRGDVLNDLNDAHLMHRRVMSLFPDRLSDTPRSDVGALYRTEPVRDAVQVLVQSHVQPEIGRLPEGYAETGVLHLKSYLDTLAGGMRVRYRIAANPSKQLAVPSAGGGRVGQRVALHGEAAEEWWRLRAAKAGLRLQSGLVTPRHPLVSRLRARAGLRFHLAQFDGEAEIHDVSALRRAMWEGIGRGKSYGCGLLSILPVRQPTSEPADHGRPPT
ncbi:type I-E CRISPR-associated protein Cas6/Cse3/CasE [Streptomyces jumonjinensis]|uniref:type I-E CRISPR-associated protein Cas6/Cse3/CasE n=1 Tax=Streptomyces jumonjinensis TaxID=1945 RepID=UPI0037B596F3